MRRILLLITDLQIGGTPTVVRELALRLHAAGSAEIEVACLAPWGPVAEQIADAGIGVTALNARNSLNLPVIVWRLVRLVRSRGIDTVFSFLVHANAVAAAASRLCLGVRWIQSIQTTQPLPRWHWSVQGVAQEAAERVVVPSVSVARVARDWASVPAEKIVVIPNAVDVPVETQHAGLTPHPDASADSIAPPALGHGPQAPPAKTQIGFIGRLDPIKRVPDLLQAVRLLDHSVHLHIFGEGAERPRLEQSISRQGLADRVTLHGAIPRPQAALAQIDVLVLPSEAEGFGLVLIEAMAAGVPVIATDAPGIRDVVRHAHTGLLVPVGSPAKLAEAIHTVLGNAVLRQALIRQGRQEVRERFSWQTVLPQYQRLLNIK